MPFRPLCSVVQWSSALVVQCNGNCGKGLKLSSILLIIHPGLGARISSSLWRRPWPRIEYLARRHFGLFTSHGVNILLKFWYSMKSTKNWKNLPRSKFLKIVRFFSNFVAFLSPVFLVIQSLVRGLVWVDYVRGVSNVLFWILCALKQNIWDASYETLYEALND